jgi:hypothetical protein
MFYCLGGPQELVVLILLVLIIVLVVGYGLGPIARMDVG